MKKGMRFFVLLALMALSYPLQAQSRMTEEQRREAKAKYEEYRKSLNLTDDQAAKVEAINSEYFESLAQLKAGDERKLAKYKKFKSLQSKKDSQMKAVLDREQYKQYERLQSEMREEFRENRRKN
jgi:Spy/CpxP family protein refolding chaperone